MSFPEVTSAEITNRRFSGSARTCAILHASSPTSARVAVRRVRLVVPVSAPTFTNRVSSRRTVCVSLTERFFSTAAARVATAPRTPPICRYAEKVRVWSSLRANSSTKAYSSSGRLPVEIARLRLTVQQGHLEAEARPWPRASQWLL
jgi:hypothetical protein